MNKMDPPDNQQCPAEPEEQEKTREALQSDSASNPNLLLPHTMRRVDWRWAVAKGFLNKETNEWNAELGGQEAYLRQRNERMLARSSFHASKVSPEHSFNGESVSLLYMSSVIN